MVFDVNRGCEPDVVAVDPMDDTHRKRFAAGQRFETLLRPLVRDGAVVDGAPLSATAARAHFEEQFALLDDSTKRFLNPHAYPAGIERGLFDLRTKMIIDVRGQEGMY